MADPGAIQTGQQFYDATFGCRVRYLGPFLGNPGEVLAKVELLGDATNCTPGFPENVKAQKGMTGLTLFEALALVN